MCEFASEVTLSTSCRRSFITRPTGRLASYHFVLALFPAYLQGTAAAIRMSRVAGLIVVALLTCAAGAEAKPAINIVHTCAFTGIRNGQCILTFPLTGRKDSSSRH
jgi:hypothetical protein